MKHWEFLLQKEGDRSWLPLDSPDVEILEGRYRVVGRSGQNNVAVEIRISHLATEEDPPKRRIQKRSARTNQDGLVVVIPFTRLQPGVWELYCSSTDLMSDLVGDAWQFAIKLQVSARDSEGEEWDTLWSPSASHAPDASNITEVNLSNAVEQPSPETPPPAISEPSLPPDPASNPEPATTTSNSVPLPPEVEEILGSSMEHLFQLAEQMSGQLVDDVMRDFKLTVEENFSQTSQSHPIPAPSEPANQTENLLQTKEYTPLPAYILPAGATPLLKLEQETLVVRWGEEITLSGQVEIDLPEELADAQASTVDLQSFKPEDLWEPAEETLALTGATIQEIQLCLRDPQSLQVLVGNVQSLVGQVPPFNFTFSVRLPDDLQTRLVLGEVLLCGVLPGGHQLTTYTTQSFIITADPRELVGELEKLNEVLDDTCSDETEGDRIDLPFELSQKLEQEQETPFLNLSFLEPDPVESPLAEPSRRFEYLAGQPLPPQLYRPNPDQSRTKTIELPGFGLSVYPQNPAAKATSVADEPEQKQPTEIHPVPSADAAPLEALAEPTLTSTSPSPVATEPATVNPSSQGESDSISTHVTPVDDPEESIIAPDTIPIESEELREPLVVVEQSGQALEATSEAKPSVNQVQADLSDSPISEPDVSEPDIDVEVEAQRSASVDLPSPSLMSFQSLKLQDRFLTRLNSLANDAELSEWLRENLCPGKSNQASPSPSSSRDKAGRAMAEEVVVDDEPLVSPRSRQRNGTRRSKVERNLEVEEPNPLILPPDEPVPTPVLDVTAGELVSGKSVNVRVKLPYLEPRIYVKLWLIDRQTRSLLDGPRWLLDFLPNSQGELETMTQLTVPFGSLEVLFEAIAIEMHTQRESHKVTVDRNVIPPDLPVVSLDDFDSRF